MFANNSSRHGHTINTVTHLLQNGIFMGPALCVPIMLLATYGLGYGRPVIPLPMRLIMNLSYLRHGLEALLIAVYGGERPAMQCPPEEYCHYRTPKNVLLIAGMENPNIWVRIMYPFDIAGERKKEFILNLPIAPRILRGIALY